MKIQNGQIWQEIDSRKTRYIVVLDCGEHSAKVKIKTVLTNFISDKVQPRISEVPNALATFALHARFGHPKGYAFIAKDMDAFLSSLNAYTHQLKAEATVVKAKPKTSIDDAVKEMVVALSAGIRPGQIWLSNESRALRFVQVLGVNGRRIQARNAYLSSQHGALVQNVVDMPSTKVVDLAIERFNGKSKGFSFVADDLSAFERSGYTTLKYQGYDGGSNALNASGEYKTWQDVLQLLPGLKIQHEKPVVFSSAPESLATGQIWRANDNRALRYVVIGDKVGVNHFPAGVCVSNVYVARVDGSVVEPLSGQPTVCVNRLSFNGKSKGFTRVADSLAQFKALGLDRAIFEVKKHWSEAPVLASAGAISPVRETVAVDVQVDDLAPKRKAIEEGRKLVAANQMWQERTDHLHMIEVIGVEGDYALAVTRYVGEDVNSQATFTRKGREFEVRLDSFLLEQKKYHLITSTK